MTAAPVMSITEELIADLEALAIEVKGWNMPVSFQEPEDGFLPDDWEWHVGQIDEEDNRYPLLHVNAHQYDSGDSEKLARYYAACNRDTILALLAERAELVKDRERLDFLISQEAFTAHIRTGFVICWPNISKWQSGQFNTAREAIDAAMQAAQ